MRTNFFTLFLISVFIAGGILSSAQAAAKPAPAASGGSEAWTGVITYTKTQAQSDKKTVDRVSGRGKDTRNWQMNFDYKATVGIFASPENNDQSIAKATITHTLTSKETNTAVEKNSCDRGKTWQEMTGTFVSETKISGDGKEDANVNIGLNSDGTYSISVGVPEIKGLLSGSESSTFSGQCTPKKGVDRTMPDTPTNIQGQSLTSDGSSRVDPDNPNQLSGSYSLTTPGGVVETIVWNLQRHVTPLRIIELKYEHMKFPKWNDWDKIVEQTGTVDGNQVKIKVIVFNASGTTKTGDVSLKETYKGDKWDGAKPDESLKEETVTLEAGEQREVELLWDSSGYSWFDDGRPRLLQRFRAELREKGKKVDEKTQNLKVAPRPLVMVPGIWTTPQYFELYQNILTTSHSYGWKAVVMVDTSSSVPVGGEGGITTTPPAAGQGSVYVTADNLTTYVTGIRKEQNAWHVDMLGHGTGGLVARLYVHKQMEIVPDNKPVVKHLLLLGTPNNGVNCAEILAALFASEETKQAAKELAPDEIALFNQYVTQRKGTKFSALAGNLVPIPCGIPNWSDGRVTEDSAKYGIEDVTLTKSLHSDLLNTENFSRFVKPHLATGPQGTYQPVPPPRIEPR